ncbi:hypothetical protein F4820DRAFT_467062 [Hypoxylon rubiginosum]|uniref:Uncharacterized protein n=1 Tax=Hypoxylon rubiginosum TaxID=110542 RepID=A0ACB9Z8X4_9PEZI|nr:hypothetical protein F4820DRAFT_467062 [Hypoxylon rubiginosum]
MQIKTAVVSIMGLLFAGQTMGIAVIATDPVSACNCPNNCSYKAGTSCRYYSGPSDSSPVLSGKCADQSGTLTCIAQ